MARLRILRQIELMLGLVLAFLLVVLMGCAALPHPTGDDRVQEDAAIQAQVEAEFDDDPRIEAEQVTLEVRHGVVTLVGWASSENERRAIEDLAWSVGGVRDVDNRIQLRQPGQNGG